MAFTKQEMQEELIAFIRGFSEGVDHMLGTELAEQMGAQGEAEASSLFLTTGALYEYGIEGVQTEGLGQDQIIDAEVADVEMFLRGLDSLRLYLSDIQVSLPRLAIRTIRTAVARHVLDGGERYSNFGSLSDDGGCPDDSYLTLLEVAYLADMDERSVRNAASSKQPGSLKTETIGKRSLVQIEEARRWLAGRKSFIPTRQAAEHAPLESFAKVTLPLETAKRLEVKAMCAGLSVTEFIEKCLTL